MDNNEFMEIRVIKKDGKRQFVIKTLIEMPVAKEATILRIQEFYTAIERHFISCLASAIEDENSAFHQGCNAEFICRSTFTSDECFVFSRSITVTYCGKVEYSLDTTDTFSSDGRLLKDDPVRNKRKEKSKRSAEKNKRARSEGT